MKTNLVFYGVLGILLLSTGVYSSAKGFFSPKHSKIPDNTKSTNQSVIPKIPKPVTQEELTITPKVKVTKISPVTSESIPDKQTPIQRGTTHTPQNIQTKTPPIKRVTIPTSVPTNVSNKSFKGGGPSFVGGNVNQIPIGGQSLSQITKRYNLTASQAANLKAQSNPQGNTIRNRGESTKVFEARKKADASLQRRLKSFNFGTNTGSGKNSKIRQRTDVPNQGATSDKRFAGKSAQQIALELTGGNINNF